MVLGEVSRKMGSYLLLASIMLTVMMLPVIGKPVRRGPPQPPIEEGASPENRRETGLAYDNYLRQVVEVLESDQDFRKKLETANISEIKSGNIAMHLEMVNHTIRTALDELKRQEITRLQQLARLQMQGTSGIDLIMNAMYRGGGRDGMRNFEIPGHLDLKNPHSFEMSDLKNLILKTTSDLEELDKMRKEEFKEYEMEKEYEKNKHLKELSEEEKKKEEARLEGLKQKHLEHPKLNHPGSKDQFEEVWDKVDHLEDQDFDPKTFFFKHDLDGNLEWSIDEVDAVLQHELDKVYDARNSPDEDDPLEREEEMNRMRRHVFQEMDKDKDFRITLKEFLDYTGVKGDQPEFEKDEGWKTIEEVAPVFSEEDYQKFLESHHAGIDGGQPSEDLKFQSEQLQGQQHQLPPQEQHPPQQQPQSQQQHEGQKPQIIQQQHEGQQLSQNQQLPQHEQIDAQKIEQQIKELQDKLNQQKLHQLEKETKHP